MAERDAYEAALRDAEQAIRDYFGTDYNDAAPASFGFVEGGITSVAQQARMIAGEFVKPLQRGTDA